MAKLLFEQWDNSSADLCTEKKEKGKMIAWQSEAERSTMYKDV
jgi:hypothetical protein